MLKALAPSEPLSVDAKNNGLLKSLIKMYAAPNSRYINYYGPPRTITTIPYHQALQLRNGMVGDQPFDLKGKAVLVGLSEILLADRKDSFYTVFSQANGIFISGVEIAATALSNIIEDTSVKPVGLTIHIFIILLWGILAGIVCRLFSVKIGALGIVGLSILYLVVAVILFKTNAYLVSACNPVIFPGSPGLYGRRRHRAFKAFQGSPGQAAHGR